MAVSEKAPQEDDYSVTLMLAAGTHTALRLEALPEKLASGEAAVGRNGTNRNFVLSELTVELLDIQLMNQHLQHIRSMTRRHFFQATGLGFGAIALQSLLARNGVAAQNGNPFAPKPPMFAPKATRVILFSTVSIQLNRRHRPICKEAFSSSPQRAPEPAVR